MTHKDIRKADDICELKTRLIDMVKAQLTKGIEGIDAKELGEVMDMIKDLSEAEKCCHEAAYYEKVAKAMDEYEPDIPEEEIEHGDVRRSSRRYREMNARRMDRSHRYPDRDWSEDGEMSHGEMMGNPMDIRTMDPEHQLAHLQKDVEAMWKGATPENRKKLKDSLAKWASTLTL